MGLGKMVVGIERRGLLVVVFVRVLKVLERRVLVGFLRGREKNKSLVFLGFLKGK